MRITCFHPYMYGRGGGERHASRVCHHLAERHEVTVYGLWGAEGIGVPEWWGGLEVKKAWEHIKTPVARRTINGLLTMLKTPPTDGCDLFIGFGPHGAVLAGRLNGSVPTIGYFFHPWYLIYARKVDRESGLVSRLLFRDSPLSLPLKAYDRGQVRRVSALGANSPHIAALVKRIYGRRCRAMMPGVEPQPLAERTSTPFGDYVFIPTRLTWHKNLHTAVRALHILRERLGRDINLVICGSETESEYLAYLLRLIDDLGLGSHIHILGFISDEELRFLYRNAVCHWFTPFKEDFGLTPIESMMQQTPVIAADDGGGVYTVVPGVTGFHVSPADASAYANLTALLIDDPGLREKMGEEGRRQALEKWVWKRHFKEWDDLVETVLRGDDA